MNKVLIPALLVLGTLGVAPAAWTTPRGQVTQPRVARRTAVVKDVYGKATQYKLNSDPEKDLNAGDILTEQTTVKTGENAAVLLQLAGGHMFRIGENTKVVLKELGKDKSFSFQVLAGNIWSAVRKVNQPTKYEVETPSAVAGVSGTVFAVFHDLASGQTMVSTHVGQVNVQQLLASKMRSGAPMAVGVGQFIQIGRANPPGRGIPLAPGNPAPPNNPVPPAGALARPESPALRQMWRTMRMQEGWIQPLNPRARLKLNRSIGLQLRKMRH